MAGATAAGGGGIKRTLDSNLTLFSAAEIRVVRMLFDPCSYDDVFKTHVEGTIAHQLIIRPLSRLVTSQRTTWPRMFP